MVSADAAGDGITTVFRLQLYDNSRRIDWNHINRRKAKRKLFVYIKNRQAECIIQHFITGGIFYLRRYIVDHSRIFLFAACFAFVVIRAIIILRTAISP